MKHYYFTIRADIISSSENKRYIELNQFVKSINERLKKQHIVNNECIIRFGDELISVFDDSDKGVEALQILLSEATNYNLPLYIGCGLDIVKGF